LIAASRKEKVEDRVAAAEKRRLEGLVMDVESFATQNRMRHVRNSYRMAGAIKPFA